MPMRRAAATLILPAALLPALLLAVPVAQAASADAVLACTGIADAAERLACFDRTVPALRGPAPAVQAARPPEAPVPPAVASAPASPAQRFGAEQLPQARTAEEEGEIGELTARVAKLAADPEKPNRMVITLDNGQVWAQRESKKFQLKPGDSVVIKPAFMGTYTLVRDGSKAILKVRRVQ